MVFIKKKTREINLKVFFALLVCFFWSNLGAQTGFLHDSILLTDYRFFKNKAWRDTVSLNIQKKDTRAFQAALVYARAIHDVPLEAFAGIELAKAFLWQKNYAEAFNWMNRTLFLDSLYAPLSPVKQYVYREAASFYSDFGTYGIAAKFMKKTVDISLKRDIKPTLRLYRSLTSYAILLQKSGQMDSSVSYYNKAINLTKSMGDYLWRSSSLNNYGMLLYGLGKNDSAMNVFFTALNTLQLKTAEDSLFLTSLNDNLAEVYASKQLYGEALRLFNTKFDYCIIHRGISRTAESGIRSAVMMMKLGRVREAEKRIKQVDSVFAIHPEINANFLTSKLGEELIAAKLNLAILEGNAPEAVKLQQQLLAIKDSFIADAQKAKLGKLENVIIENAERYSKEIEIERLKSRESSARARFNRIVATGALISGVLIVAIIILLYRRKTILTRLAFEQEAHKRELAESGLQNEKLEKIRLRQQLELNRITIEQESYKRELAEVNYKNEQLEKDHISQQLELKKRDVTDYALAHTQRKKILDEVLSRLKDIKKSGNPAEQLQELSIVLKRQLQGDHSNELEPGQIEKVNHEFFEKLSDLCPGLTPGEKDLTGLIRLNFSSKEISSLRNISPASVRISKFRLKKKLGLGSETDLAEFIRKI